MRRVEKIVFPNGEKHWYLVNFCARRTHPCAQSLIRLSTCSHCSTSPQRLKARASLVRSSSGGLTALGRTACRFTSRHLFPSVSSLLPSPMTRNLTRQNPSQGLPVYEKIGFKTVTWCEVEDPEAEGGKTKWPAMVLHP